MRIMKEIVINKGKLKDDEITEVLDKARIVLRNDDGEFKEYTFYQVVK